MVEVWQYLNPLILHTVAIEVVTSQRIEIIISFLCCYQGNWADVLQNKERKQVRTQPSPNLNKKWNTSWFRSAKPRNIGRSGGRFKKCGQTVWIAHFHHSEVGKRRRKGNSFISPSLAGSGRRRTSCRLHLAARSGTSCDFELFSTVLYQTICRFYGYPSFEASRRNLSCLHH